MSANIDEHNSAIATPIPIISVEGSAFERGKRYGQAAAERAANSVESYRKMFETCDINWQRAQDIALPCMEKAFEFFPSLEQEISGLASGSGIDIASLAALNCRTEILPPDYLSRATGLPASKLPDAGHLTECTSFAFARESDPVWLSQNWDWLGLQRSSLVLLRSSLDSGQSHMTVTEAGMLAKIGLNDSGFGITLNILRSQNDGTTTGMPIHMFLRGLLDCESVDEASELARQISFAGSSNIMIADKSGAIASIEATPKGAKIIAPDGEHLCHTNHFLHKELAGDDAGLLGNISTESRLTRAEAQIAEVSGINEIKELLSDTSDGLQSICRFPDTTLPETAQVETVVGVAMNLSQKELWVSAAQPSITPLIKHTLH